MMNVNRAQRKAAALRALAEQVKQNHGIDAARKPDRDALAPQIERG
jgi:hypothetical protein